MNIPRDTNLDTRERALRLVFELEEDYPSQRAAIRSIAEKSGMSAETLRSGPTRPRQRGWPSSRAHERPKPHPD
jgi:hypothetical protein